MKWISLELDSNHDVVEIDESNYYLSAKRAINARLTQVATAVRHFLQGSKQIFRVPGFLRHAEQTRELVWRSAKTNGIYYLTPAILFSYLNPTLREMDFYSYSSDYLEYATKAIVFFYMVRLLARRKETNIEYLIANSRVIKNDIEKILPHALAEGLATELTALFNKQFKNTQEPEFIQASLFLDLYKYFEDFFKKASFTTESFRALQEERLSPLFQTILKEHYSIESTEFPNKLAQEFITILASDFQTTETSAKEDELVLSLWSLVEKEFSIEEAENYATDIRKGLLQAKTNVQPFLPIVYYPPCSCKDDKVILGTEYNSLDYYRKVNVANLSSIPYYLGNVIFTFLPDLWESASKIPLEIHVGVLLFTMLAASALFIFDVITYKSLFSMQFMGLLSLSLAYVGTFIPPELFYGMQWSGYFGRSLLAGLGFNELLIAKTSHCTRHRTDENMRHKMHAFGIGLTQTIISEIAAQRLLFLTGVRNPCTNNAIDEFLTLLNTISTLAYNERLPGTGKNTWNLFFLSQAATRALLDKMNNLLQQRPKLPEIVITALKAIAKFIGFLAWILLGRNEYYPTPPPKEPKKELQPFLLQHETILYLLQLFRNDLENILKYIKSAQTLTWLARPVSWVAPNLFVPFIVIASKLLNDKDLLDLLEKINWVLDEIKSKEKDKVKIIEDDPNQDQLIVAPALLPEPEIKKDDFEWVDIGDFSNTPLQRFAFLGRHANRLPNALVVPTQTPEKESSPISENRQSICRFMWS